MTEGTLIDIKLLAKQIDALFDASKTSGIVHPLKTGGVEFALVIERYIDEKLSEKGYQRMQVFLAEGGGEGGRLTSKNEDAYDFETNPFNKNIGAKVSEGSIIYADAQGNSAITVRAVLRDIPIPNEMDVDQKKNIIEIALAIEDIFLKYGADILSKAFQAIQAEAREIGSDIPEVLKNTL